EVPRQVLWALEEPGIPLDGAQEENRTRPLPDPLQDLVHRAIAGLERCNGPLTARRHGCRARAAASLAAPSRMQLPHRRPGAAHRRAPHEAAEQAGIRPEPVVAVEGV